MGHLKTPVRIALTVLLILGLARWGIPSFLGKTGATSLSVAAPVSLKTLLGVGGHPNKMEDVQEWASKTVQFVGAQACGQCHGERRAEWSAGRHASVTCESCHGLAREHVQQGARPVVNTSPALCAGCHDQITGRPASFPQVAVEKHGGGSSCLDCHNPHSPRFTAAAPAESSVGEVSRPAAPASVPKVPHSLEGRSDCAACHGPGQAKPFPANHAGRTNDVCLLCHRKQ